MAFKICAAGYGYVWGTDKIKIGIIAYLSKKILRNHVTLSQNADNVLDVAEQMPEAATTISARIERCEINV